MNVKRILLALYTTTGLIEIVSVAMELELVHYIAKPLLMIWLLLYFVVDVSNRQHRLFWFIVMALVFSWLGDVLLMYQNNKAIYFMLGLGAFLIAHIFYIISYRKARINNYSESMSKPRLARYDFFLLVIYLTIIMVLKNHLDNMLAPVLVYAGTITYMAVTAMHRFGTTSNKSFWMVMLGALVFMFSDTTIAFNKFLEPVNHASVIIMGTYLIAQYLIVEGLSKHILIEVK